MGRAPCCDKVGLKKGPWTPEEDQILIDFIAKHGHSNWRALPKQSGLLRCGKSCRLRWINYLKPDIKRGNFTREEEDTIIHLHEVMGNRWSAIAARLPGRTDNEIKNVWHTHLKKRLKEYQTTKSTTKKNNNARKSRDDTTQNVATPTTTTTDDHNNSTSTGNSFLETTSSFGTSVQNQHVTSSGSPQQSSTTTTDEFSSGTEVSSLEFPNNVGAIMDVQSFNNSIHETCFEDFPIIDESFWESQELPLDDGHNYYYNNTTTTSTTSEEFSNIIIDDNGLQFETLLRDQEITSIINQSEETGCPGLIFDDDDDNMDFWLDVFVQAGGAPELPEF